MGMDSPVWVDVYDAAGTLQAVGPITPISWHWHWQEDLAGTVEMELPLGDYKNTQLSQLSILRAYSIVNGAIASRGHGLVENVERIITPDGEEMVRVSGGDIMRQLARKSVAMNATGRLQIKEWRDNVEFWDGAVQHGEVRWLQDPDPGVDDDQDLPEAYDGNPATVTVAFDLMTLGNPHEYAMAVVGFDRDFDRMNVTLNTAGSADANTLLRLQYFNAEAGWKDAAGVVDGTVSGTKTMQQSGTISWTLPTDWDRVKASKASGEWKWVRLALAAGGDTEMTGIKIAEITLRAEMPTTNGINLIMANAPAGWDSSGYGATSVETYLEFSAEDSVLTALSKLAEATGDHFIWAWDGSTYSVDWQTSFSASGYTARTGDDVRNLAQNAEAVIIHSLSQVIDSAEAASRIVPYGGGIGEQRVTLANATLSDGGYTLSTANNNLRRDATESAIGESHKVVQFTNVVEMDNGTSLYVDPESASNALYRAAKGWLDQHTGGERFYELSYVPYNAAIAPGTTLEAVAHRWKDGEHVLDVDTIRDAAPLYVMGVDMYIGPDGEAPTILEVATTDRRPTTTDAIGLAQLSQIVFGMQSMGLSGSLTQNVMNVIGAAGEQLNYNPATHGVPDDGTTSAVAGWTAFAASVIPLTGGTAVCQGHYLFDDNHTIPDHVAIEAFRGTRFSVAASKTLTIEGPLRAGRYKIFDLPSDANGIPTAWVKGQPPIDGVPVEWFGAVPDGVTDCSAAIMAAAVFASADSAGSNTGPGVPLLFGGGIYKHTLPLRFLDTIGGLHLKGGTSYSSNAVDNTILLSAPATPPGAGTPFYALDLRTSQAGATIEDGFLSMAGIYLKGSDEDYTYGIYGYDLHVTLRDVRIGYFDLGIYAGRYGYYSVFDHVDFYRCRSVGLCYYAGAINGVGFTNCRFTYTTTAGTGTPTGAIKGACILRYFGTDVALRNCYFEGNAGYSLYGVYGEQLLVDSCYFENPASVLPDIYVVGSVFYRTILKVTNSLMSRTDQHNSIYAQSLLELTAENNQFGAYLLRSGLTECIRHIDVTTLNLVGNKMNRDAVVSPYGGVELTRLSAHGTLAGNNISWNYREPHYRHCNNLGDTIINSVAAADAPAGWICTTPGVGNQVAALNGVTGTTDAASRTVTVALAGTTVMEDLLPGSYIQIAGETFGGVAYAQIIAVTSPVTPPYTVVVTVAADTGVADAAVSWHTALYQPFGLIGDAIEANATKVTVNRDIVATGKLTHMVNSIRGVFTKVVTDEVATTVFTITTTNEPGNTDAGGYACFVKALIWHGYGTAAGSSAAKAFQACFCRTKQSSGAGVDSAVSEVVETASAATASATRDIGAVTMTTVEVDEYITGVQFTVDGTGTSITQLTVIASVEVIYYTLATPPVLAAA